MDDGSPSRTIQIAKQVARVAVTRKKEDQTKGLLYRMQPAEYTMIITVEPTTGNNPKAYRTYPIEYARAKYDVAKATQSNYERKKGNSLRRNSDTLERTIKHFFLNRGITML